MDSIEGPKSPLHVLFTEGTYQTIREINGEVVVGVCHVGDRVFNFLPKQWMFLRAIAQGATFDAACEKATLSPKSAQRFLRSREYRDYFAAAQQMDDLVRGFPAMRVLYETIRQFKGEIKLDESQNKALDRLERMLMPRKQEGITAGTVNVQVNNFPNLPPDVVEKLKALGDARAGSQDAKAA